MQTAADRKLEYLTRLDVMPAEQLIPVPFLLDYTHLEVDKSIIFILAMLIAVTVNAEGQAMVATTLGDIQKKSKERFHFNPIFHLDIPGMVCFAIAGFGWPRRVSIDQKKFKYPITYLILSRFAGPFANLLLCGIVGSIIWILHSFGIQDQVFSIILSVNLTVFVFSFLPFPPLAGASIFYPLLPKKQPHSLKILGKLSPYILVSLFIILKLQHIEIINDLFFPVVRGIFSFITG